MASLPRLDTVADLLPTIPGQPPSLVTATVRVLVPPAVPAAAGPRALRARDPAAPRGRPGPPRRLPLQRRGGALVDEVAPRGRRRRDGGRGVSDARSTAGGGDVRLARGEEILRVEDLVTHFPIHSSGCCGARSGRVQAVDGVSFSLAAGETLGLVGESGCGKSTVARTVMKLVEPTAGRIVFKGQDITGFSRRAEMRPIRQQMQIIFQDPYSSLNPRMSVHDIVAEPLRVHGRWKDDGSGAGRRAARDRRAVPGARQAVPPRVLRRAAPAHRDRPGAGAEPPAADPRRARVRPRRVHPGADRQPADRAAGEFDLAYLFIAHDLSVVRHISDRVAVMYLGRIAELGGQHEVYVQPTHPYTQALLSAVPRPDPDAPGLDQHIVLEGDVPSPSNPPSGCRFRTRCWKAEERCAREVPELIDRLGTGTASPATSPRCSARSSWTADAGPREAAVLTRRRSSR
jgi:oligopeptide/dipeptide ABC transporter ATP-binding protein